MKSMKRIIAGFVMAVFACAAVLPLRAALRRTSAKACTLDRLECQAEGERE